MNFKVSEGKVVGTTPSCNLGNMRLTLQERELDLDFRPLEELIDYIQGVGSIDIINE